MNQPLKHMPRLQIKQLPPAVESALAEFLKPGYQIVEAGGDLIVTGDAEDVGLPGVPVLHVTADGPRATLTRLFDLITDMIAAPALYLDPFKLGDAILKPAQKILSRGAEEITLTEKETDILIHLARAGGKPIPRDRLLHSVWGYGDGIDTHTLETHVYRLRQKTGDDLVMTDDDGYYVRL